MTQAEKLWHEHHAAIEELLAEEKTAPLQQAAILFIASYCYKLTSAEADVKLHAIPKAPGLQSILQDTAHKFWKTITTLSNNFPEDVLKACCACWPAEEVSQRQGRKILPPEVDELALRLLGIEPGDTLIDLWGHGGSGLLTAGSQETAHTNFYSLEQDNDSYLLSFLRSRCQGGKVQPLPIKCLYTPLPPALRPAKLYLDTTGEAAPETLHEKNRSIRQELSRYMEEQSILSTPVGDGEAALQQVFKNLQILNAILLHGQQEKCRTVIICESGRLTEAALSGKGIPKQQLELAARLPARLAPELPDELDLLLLGHAPCAEPRLVDVSNLGDKIDGLTKLREQDLDKILILCRNGKLPAAKAKKTTRPRPEPVPEPEPEPVRQKKNTSEPAPPQEPIMKPTPEQKPAQQAKPAPKPEIKPAEAPPQPKTEKPPTPEPVAEPEPPVQQEKPEPAREPEPASMPGKEPEPTFANAGTCLLKDLLKSVQRGPALTNSKLQPLRSEAATSCRYLNLKDIADGLLSMEMDSLKEIPEKYQKYCLKPGDVVLTKTTPFKAASFDSEELTDMQILPGANIYRLEPDQEKILPSYLTLYLQSPQGQEQLARHASGKTSVLIISVQELLELAIPLPGLEEQMQLATKYRRLRKRLLETLHRAAEIRQKMNELL